MSGYKKIVVIGNAAGGKTKLSLRLGQIYKLPVTHVDRIQFLPGLRMRPHQETRQILDEIIQQEAWLIDGFGPLDNLERRFELADLIVFIDLPLWRHYWWLGKRQIQNLWSRRAELPEGCHELNWAHTRKMIDAIRKTHVQMRPELMRILGREQLKAKTIHIRDLKSWSELYQKTSLPNSGKSSF